MPAAAMSQNDRTPLQRYTSSVDGIPRRYDSLASMPSRKASGAIDQEWKLQLNQLRDGVALGLEGYHSSINALLLFVPLGLASGIFDWRDETTFLFNFVGMIPLAMLLAKSTEDIAEHTNETLGALVNVTFGNAIELILCINALRAGRMNLILNTIVGSILSNLLLVMGSAFVAGGSRFKEQTVLLAVAEANSDMLSFSVFGLCIPSLFSMAISSGSVKQQSIESMSLVCAICLLIMYVLYLIFSLYTHSEFYEPPSGITGSVELGDSVDDGGTDVDHGRSVASLPLAITVLLVTIVTVTIASELLIGALDGFSKSVGFSESFIAVIFLPVIGNAVEHFSAILVAYRDKIDLAIGIACGSSVQVALFAAPVIVICSWFIPGPRLTLSFDVFQTASLAFSVFVVNATLRDTKTNWLEGAVLVMCYIILAAAFFFMP